MSGTGESLKKKVKDSEGWKVEHVKWPGLKSSCLAFGSYPVLGAHTEESVDSVVVIQQCPSFQEALSCEREGAWG